ncbi:MULTISPECIES: transporter substrate-binding domain-containing protein [unclassified Rhizobium]|uniref:transporter substrate-binding domain-containing protein n=1 Tax=unclassified Rhizobium TaxID=2613769 RepID=UPI0002719821|nr:MULTISPECIES: transporter substrate-binding domain-containing protein [unclassified Rhizobium]EJL52642.1 periplasmic component of amino acid ABC-type transporter/signal transduction system [Rhizobium sp. CF122]MBB3397947.1 polar amino acid transport system substrate-binding protein [Rhizobium sp. BK060]MBB4166569.1 polar amino acid transport system substrate-binding protein [Rhizobium sp. BK538]TCM81555.1 amino acid ABC transporter substrate-binding protein (PAAT family) [Rhizobium sp. BK068
MKRILTTLAALAIAAGSAFPSFAGMIDDIRSRGTVRIGVSLGGEPIGFRDAQNNPVGYDVDVATQLAQKLGVPVEFVDVSGDARISMLVSGQIDVAVANTSATLERAKTVNFTIPYNRAGLRVIVQKDAGIKELKDLAGKKVVVGRGTTGENFLKTAVPDAQLVYVDQFAPDGVLQLQQKRVDAAIEDSSLLDYLATKTPSLVTLPGLYSNDPIGIAVAKGDPEFVRWLDMFVSDYIQSGAYAANYKKWWGAESNPPALNPQW